MHTSSVRNYFEHGFYCFNPTLIHDFCSHNDCEVITSQLSRFRPDISVNRGERINLLTSGLIFSAFSRAGAVSVPSATLLFFAARKTEGRRRTIIPQQGFYLEKQPESSDRASRKKSRAMRLLRQLAKRSRRLLAFCTSMNADAAIKPINWETIQSWTLIGQLAEVDCTTQSS